MSAAEKIRALRADLARAFPERQGVIDGTLCAVLGGEHVLLLGPPGTAKSSLARAIARAFGGRYFERLLSKFSTPDELFGPISLQGLEQDRFYRVVTAKLPEAEFGFLDEVWKASSAILNTLLPVMNERIFHNDGDPISCPLITLFGASNELPEGKELEALFDRFLLRFDVQYLVQPANLREVLLAPDPGTAVSLSMEELRTAQAEAAAVDVTVEVLEALVAIRDSCQAAGIVASDRRWKKSLKLTRASAYIAGEKKTSLEDLIVLADSLWREPRERAKVMKIVGAQADPVAAQAVEILESAREIARDVTKLRDGEQSTYVAAASKALGIFIDQKNKLTELARSGGRRSKVAVQEAEGEVLGMHAETQRLVAQKLGLGPTLRGMVGG